jgi:diguanylate cyclase (GGDEF)-like protein
MMPEAQYVGCSTNGNICGGVFTRADISITCAVFECATTMLETLQYEISEQSAAAVSDRLTREIDSRPWVKAVELLITIRGMSLSAFCEDLQHVRSDVAVFGGGAFNGNINDNAACVFSRDGGYSENGVTFILYGGSDFHLSAHSVTGWKAVGKELKVSRAHRNVLYELDGVPAYEVYHRYLDINNDEHFFANTLEFPFLYQHHGIEILRAPVSSNPDGSLVMTSDIQENVIARLAYGDPKTILASVREVARTMGHFRPQAIAIFSCAGRRTFWGDEEVDREMQPFELMAPTFGFFTSSEFLRTDIHVNQHNVTLVIIAMREGLPQKADGPRRVPVEAEKSREVSLVQRLATFIDAATEDLNEANRSLRRAAVTDALTGLKNRGETQRCITDMAERRARTFSLLMIDLDDFKQINDRYGHVIGDKVLIGLADHLRYMLRTRNPAYFAGRWGGEEFMVVLPGVGLDKAAAFAERIREGFAEINFEQAGRQTMSVGVAQLRDDEDADALCIRVDDALYAAKRSGKNRVVTV